MKQLNHNDVRVLAATISFFIIQPATYHHSKSSHRNSQQFNKNKKWLSDSVGNSENDSVQVEMFDFCTLNHFISERLNLFRPEHRTLNNLPMTTYVTHRA